MTKEIKKIAVIGAGQMGTGIAQCLILKKFDVMLMDLSMTHLEAAQKTLEKNLQRLEEKGKISLQDRQAAGGCLSLSMAYSDLKPMDLVIEAATEEVETKKAIFRTLCQHIGSETLLATNTSSLSITRLAAVTDRPEQFIGMHFMNPVPIMRLVELIRGLKTSKTTFAAVERLTTQLDKVPVEANDFPAFIVNRIMLPMINEAIFALYEGVGDVKAIDSAMRLGGNHPMGPLALADLIGLDTCLSIIKILNEGFADSKYRPCPLLIKYVEAGWLGRKTHKGFYDYSVTPAIPSQ